MGRIFKTTAIFTALFLAFIAFSQAGSAKIDYIWSDTTGVMAGGTYEIFFDWNESNSVKSAKLFEGDQVVSSCGGGETSCLYKEFSFAKSPGIYSYKALVVYTSGSEKYIFGVDGSPVTVSVFDQWGRTSPPPSSPPPPPPTTLPACSSNNCSNLQTNCKCGVSDIGQTARYCFNGQPFERQVDCQAAERATGGSGTGQTPPPGQGQTIGPVVIVNPLGTLTFQQLLNIIINFIFWVGITLAPVIFIAAGFLYVTAAGSTQRLEMAKSLIIYTLIGLVVLLFARGLVAVLQSILGVTS